MKKIFFLSTLLLSVTFIYAQKADTLTNETIIKLNKSGFSADIIESKIKSSPAVFDVSFDGMMNLKENKVPEKIINLMISNPNGNASKNNSVPAAAETGGSALSTGIYILKSASEKIEMVPTYISSKKTDRTNQVFLGTFADADIKVVIPENHSATEIKTLNPKFLFVFDTTKTVEQNPWFGKMSSPKNFFLIKLKATKKNRELVIGKSNAFSEGVEIKEKQKILLKFKKIGPGQYEVSPTIALEPGEYGFIFSKASWDTESGRIYDFSIL